MSAKLTYDDLVRAIEHLKPRPAQPVFPATIEEQLAAIALFRSLWPPKGLVFAVVSSSEGWCVQASLPARGVEPITLPPWMA